MDKDNSSCLINAKLIAKTGFTPHNEEIPKRLLKHKAPNDPVHLDIDTF